MEENKKLYSQKAIGIATFFGGPMAAGYLVKKNYQSLGQESHAKKAFLIGIVSTLLLFAGIFSIPESIIDKIPNAIIPAIYTGIIYLIVEKLQGQNLKEHLEYGRVFYSAWRAAGIGAISMMILLLSIVTTAFIASDLSKTEPNSDIATTDIEFDSFFDNKEAAVKSKHRNISIRGDLKANEIGIKFPNEANVGEEIKIVLINTKESLVKVKILKSSNYKVRGMVSSSNGLYKNGVMTGTYTLKFYLTFNAKGEYEFNESWFENLPENLNLRTEKIKIN